MAGLSSKIHADADGHGCPLRVVVTGGQRNDGALPRTVLEGIHVQRLGPGWAKTRPDAFLADRGYTTSMISSHCVSAVSSPSSTKCATVSAAASEQTAGAGVHRPSTMRSITGPQCC